jgi:hypothetical protein
VTFDQKMAVAGLAASLLTPFALLSVGYFINRRLRELEGMAARQRKISDTRFDLYKEIGFQLNDLYSYFLFVGNWKELSAREIIARKRALDRHVYTYRPIFSVELFAKYTAYMDSAFRTHGDFGSDAQLRTSPDRRPEKDSADAAWFTGEDNRPEIKASYQAIIDQLAAELGVESTYDRSQQ